MMQGFEEEETLSEILLRKERQAEERARQRAAQEPPADLARAGLSYVKHRRVTQGGSTITQQVIKNTYLTKNIGIKTLKSEVALKTVKSTTELPL